jgi:acyl carrier protein
MDIKVRIRQFIAQNLLFNDKGFQYEDSTSFLEEGIVDSLGIMELVTYVEDTYPIKVDDQDLTPDNFDSVSKLANFIQNRLCMAA